MWEVTNSVVYRDPVTKKRYEAANMAIIMKQVQADRALITAKDVEKAKAYYAVSSKVLEITDITKTTPQLYTQMRAAAPKTIEEAAIQEYTFAKQQIAKLVPLQKTEVEKPMALSVLAEVARSAMGALRQPTVQQAIGGALGAIAPTGLGAARATVAGKVQYTVIRDKGRLLDLRTGRTIGYTPQSAKKRFKTKRRRRRLTKKDVFEWQMRLAIAQVQAGQPAMIPTY